MRLLLIQPSRKTVHDLGEWPGAAPQPLAPPEDDGFYWLSAERPELEVQLPAVQALLQQLCGTPLVDLHVSDLLNAQIPSTFDFTSDYDVMLFRRLRHFPRVPEQNALQPLETVPVGYAVFDQLLLSIHPPACALRAQSMQRLLEPGKLPEKRSIATRLPPSSADLMLRQHQILGNMLGADIDFVVRGIDSKTRSVVASRREAMMRKRQIFYFDLDADGMYRVYEGRIVQARVIAVAEKVIRVEVFGVECSILARDLAWDWIGDAHERFAVGDEVLVRILSVRRESPEDLSIRADIKSTSENTDRDNLQKCRIQGKYAGKVTDVHKGVVYVRLSNGVNAVAHSCYDYRMPGKKDDVSFAVTRLDMERGVAVGIITRIIRQNL